MAMLDAVQDLLKTLLARGGDESAVKRPPETMVEARKSRNEQMKKNPTPSYVESNSPLASIPNELLVKILSLLDSRSLQSVRAVCLKWERLATFIPVSSYALPQECSDEQLFLILEIFPCLASFSMQNPVRLGMNSWTLINTRAIPIQFPSQRAELPYEVVTWMMVLRGQLHINHLFVTELCVLNSLIAVEEVSRQPSLLALRAWVHSYLGHIQEGLRDVEEMRKLRAHMGLFETKVYATLLSKAGRHAEAIKVLDEALQNEMAEALRAPLLAARASVFTRALNHDAALRDLEQALTIDPNFIAAWQEYGNELDYVGRHEEALVAIDKAISLDPDVGVRHHFRAWTLTALERYEEALIACNRSLELSPGNDTFLYARGFVLQMLGRYEEALVDFKGSLDKCTNPAVHYRYALCLVAVNRNEEADKHFHLVTQSEATYGGDFYAKGMVLQRMNRDLEALEQFNVAYQRQPGNWRYLIGRAESLFSQKLFDQALADWRKACGINPRLKSRLEEKISVAQSNVRKLTASWNAD